MDGLSSLLGAYSAPEPSPAAAAVSEAAAAEPAPKKARPEAPLLPPVDSDEEEEEKKKDRKGDTGERPRKTARTETLQGHETQAARLPARPRHLVPPQVRRGVPNRP